MHVIVSESEIRVRQREVKKDHVYEVFISVGVSTLRAMTCSWASVPRVTSGRPVVPDPQAFVVDDTSVGVRVACYTILSTRLERLS